MTVKGKVERFCEEYIIDHNATQAAIRAGYKASSAANQGSRLIRNDEVLARVRELQKEYNITRCFAEKDRILADAWNLYDIATAAKPVMEYDRFERKYVPTGEYQIDGRTAAKSLEIIAKLNGFFSEKVKVGADPEDADEVKFCIEVKKTGDTLGTE